MSKFGQTESEHMTQYNPESWPEEWARKKREGEKIEKGIPAQKGIPVEEKEEEDQSGEE